MARNSNNAQTVAHDDVLPLAHDPEASFLERANGVEMIDARDLRQGLDGYFDFANVLAAKLLIDDR